MPININYLKKTEIEPNVNLVLFVNEKFNVNSLKNIFQIQSIYTLMIY